MIEQFEENMVYALKTTYGRSYRHHVAISDHIVMLRHNFLLVNSILFLVVNSYIHDLVSGVQWNKRYNNFYIY